MVAKFARQFNKSVIEPDKKKEYNRKIKHKSNWRDRD